MTADTIVALLLEEEFIAWAAVRIGPSVYKGTTHVDAYGEAADALGVDFDALYSKGADEGFLTSEGRYVDREEAFAIAQQAAQTQGIEPGKYYLSAEKIVNRAGRPELWL